MNQIYIFLLATGCAVAGYFLRRWWEGQSLKERIRIITDFLRLHNEMAGANIPEKVLSNLRRDIFSRNRWQRSSEIEVLDKIGTALLDRVESENADESGLRSQSEMNQYAFHLADLAEREMNYLVVALEQKLDSDEQAYFRKTQRAWTLFAKRQAQFESVWVAGGSMQPMIRASEYRDLAIE